MQEKMHSIKKKSSKDFIQIFSYCIIILLIIPRINILKFDLSWASIRIEDLICFFLAINIILNFKKFDLEIFLSNNFAKLFLLLITTSFISGYTFFYNELSYFAYIRQIEIIVFFFYLNQFNLNKKLIIKYLKIYLLLNLLFVIFQYFQIFGAFTSKGYTQELSSTRIPGLTGGGWELAFVSSIIFFILYEYYKKINIFYLIITLFLIFISGNRGVIFAFIISIFFLIFSNKKKNFFLFIFIFLIFGIILNYTLVFYKIDIFVLFNYFIDFIIYQEVPIYNYILSNEHYSFVNRLYNWLPHYINYAQNFVTVLFGTGLNAIYYESTILRLLFSSGLVGIYLIIYNLKKFKIYIILFLLFSGITLDYLAAIKTFLFVILYFQFSKKP